MRTSLSLLAVLALATTAAGCGGGDDNKSDSGSTPAATPTATATATATPAATASHAITVRMTEFAFEPKDAVAKAGKVTISAPNDGKVLHELVVLKTSTDPAMLPVKSDGSVDERDAVGEIPDVEAGKTKKVTLDLKPGKYAMVCNLPGHYKSGMYGSITVQ